MSPRRDWLWYIIALMLSGLVTYYTAQQNINSELTKLEERENDHYQQMSDQINQVRSDVRDLRSELSTRR